MEVSPPFVDVAVRRWQKATGQDAVHEGDDKTYAHVEVARRNTHHGGPMEDEDGESSLSLVS
jgi:hypothetical protein